ncbi:hypothetical protein H5T51_02205 [Candidatus Bathyarchaeota archaeon]|nr:hypothetical protein [Candidatus Bathyarchaeota archaeon]
MASLDDYVSRIEETCGEERHFIVFLKYERSKEAIDKILKRAKLERSISNIIYELNFDGISLRVYSSGKILVKNIKEKDVLLKALSKLLL